MPMSKRTRDLNDFPSLISREGFAWYISGLTDGEGCFSLLLDDRVRPRRKRQDMPTPSASFAINLRRDDDGILKLIRSFFQCGSLVYGGTTQQCTLRFRKLDDLEVIVAHFDRFNLFAKKKEDFKIWREGVRLMLFVSERKQKRSQRYGSSYKWTKVDHDYFVSLKNRLTSGRKLKSNEESDLRDTPQSLVVLDGDMCSMPIKKSSEG